MFAWIAGAKITDDAAVTSRVHGEFSPKTVFTYSSTLVAVAIKQNEEFL